MSPFSKIYITDVIPRGQRAQAFEGNPNDGPSALQRVSLQGHGKGKDDGPQPLSPSLPRHLINPGLSQSQPSSPKHKGQDDALGDPDPFKAQRRKLNNSSLDSSFRDDTYTLRQQVISPWGDYETVQNLPQPQPSLGEFCCQEIFRYE